MKARIYQSSGLWYAKVNEDGITKNVPLHVSTREKAEEIISENGDILLSSGNKKTLEDCLILYSNPKKNPYYQERLLTGHPIKESSIVVGSGVYRSLFKIIDDELLSKSINRITSQDCKVIRQEVINSGLESKTASNYFNYFCTMMKHLYSERIIKTNPTDGMMRIANIRTSPVAVPSMADIKRIAKSPLWKDQMRRDVFLLYAMTGMRRAELAGIKPCQISEERIKKEKVHVLKIDRQRNALHWNGDTTTPKGGIIRTIPLANSAWAILEKYLTGKSEDDFVFKRGRVFFEFNNLNESMLKLIKNDEARNIFSTHKLRHFFNRELVWFDSNLTKATGEYCGWNHQVQGLDDLSYMGAMQKRYFKERLDQLIPVTKAIDKIFSWVIKIFN